MLYVPLLPELNAPLYMRLYHAIRRDLVAGRLPTGHKLMSKRQMAQTLNVSVNTVDQAYQQLCSEGYLYARPKVGFFTCDIDSLVPYVRTEPPSEHLFSVSADTNDPIQIDFSPNMTDMSLLSQTNIRKIFRDVLSDDPHTLFAPCDPCGLPLLRNAICQHLVTSRGLVTSPDRILLGAGTDYLLALLVILFSHAGLLPHVAIEDPAYRKAYQIFSHMHILVTPVPLDDAGICLTDDIKNTVNIVYTTPSHQFPSGIIMPAGRRGELLSWAQASTGRYIIEDDYDSDFRYTGYPIPAIGSMDHKGCVIYLGSFSKTLSPGIRVSYLVLPARLAAIYRKQLNFFHTTISTPEQLVLAKLIMSGEYGRHVQRAKTLYRKKRDMLACLLKPYHAIQIQPSGSGLHLLIAVNNLGTEAELIEKARQNNVRVYGISDHFFRSPYEGLSPEYNAPHLMLGYAGLSESDMTKGVRRLADAWHLT